MRTTVTLEPDVAKLLEDEVHRARKPFKQVLNDAVRRGLLPSAQRPQERPYRLIVHRTKLRAGFDPAGFNRLAAELDDEALARRIKP